MSGLKLPPEVFTVSESNERTPWTKSATTRSQTSSIMQELRRSLHTTGPINEHASRVFKACLISTSSNVSANRRYTTNLTGQSDKKGVRPPTVAADCLLCGALAK